MVLPTLVIMAKAPVAGSAKTRLTPPCTPDVAAWIARAALADTLDAVVATPWVRPLLALDGEPGPWLPRGVPVVPQCGDGLGARIEAVLLSLTGPVLVIGMDTPQVRPTLLAAAVELLQADGVDAVLGRATDGGWWALGVREPVPGLFDGVPMSTRSTARRQLVRLRGLGLAVASLPVLRDVDVVADAIAVAARVPGSRFAREVVTHVVAASTPTTAGAAAAGGVGA